MLLKACIVCFKEFPQERSDGQESAAVTGSDINKAVSPVSSVKREDAFCRNVDL
jgi:hypothetical protein